MLACVALGVRSQPRLLEVGHKVGSRSQPLFSEVGRMLHVYMKGVAIRPGGSLGHLGEALMPLLPQWERPFEPLLVIAVMPPRLLLKRAAYRALLLSKSHRTHGLVWDSLQWGPDS